MLWLCVTFAVTLGSRDARAQTHEQHRPAHEPERAHGPDGMRGALGIPRARWGSGTSWLPDSSPMYALMGMLGDGGWMAHGNVFAGYDWFGGPRGSDRLSGETVGGEPLHDRQHPHDLFMEVAASYTLPVSSAFAVQLYAAPAGEPALGPTAFPHRISAASDPLAALGHHWQDSTHIAFGVLTASVFTRHVKLDASWFNGREPDEGRYDFDLRRPDSHAVRLTLNPSARWSLQSSYGYLASPELHEPEVSVRRVTASATYDRRRGSENNWATTAVFGENFGPFGSFTPALGARASAGYAEPGLDAYYGERVLLGLIACVQLRPVVMAH
ncbi:MAG: hypothetical protein AMXMBFR56_57750 [Polyangiaceae bacterium]